MRDRPRPATPGDDADGQAVDRRAIVELEELAGRLRQLHAVMDTALGAAADAPTPTPPPAPAPPSRRRVALVLSCAGAGALLLALALLAWLWSGNLAPEAGGARSAIPAEAVPADMPPETASADAAPPAAAAPPQRLRLAGASLHGVAGQPIPLGIALPEGAIDTNLSVAVAGVPAPARLTAGMRFGEDGWMVAAGEIGGTALLTPAAYPGGQFGMDVRLVSSDGGITPARRLEVSVEPSPAFAAPADEPFQADHENHEEPPAIPAHAALETPPSADAPPETYASLEEPAPEEPSPEEPAPRESAAAETAPSANDAPADETGEAAEPVRTAPVSTHVNMRARPFNDAPVVTVVPAGRQVGVIECRQWCEVTFAGKHGWIHARFVGGERASGQAAAAAPASSRSGVPAAVGYPRSQPSAEKSSGGFWKKILPF